MQILVKIAFVFLPFIGATQIAFYRNYANNGYDFGQGIVQLEDSSYTVVGTSGSFASHSQAFLMHVDSLGDLIWSNHFGGTETEWGRRVLYKKNFGYFVCGHSNSFGTGDYDFYMAKVGENGLEEWSETYGDDHWERLMDAALTRDTGAILVGEKENGATGTDIFLVRTDINGDTLWTKTIENPGEDAAKCVSVYQDSLLYIAGNWYHADSSQVKSVIFKMHDDGTMLDTLLFSEFPGNYEINDMQIIDDTLQALGSHQIGNNEWDYTFYRTVLTPGDFTSVFLYNSFVPGNYFGDVFTTYGNNSRRYMAVSYDGTGWTQEGGRDIQIQRTNSFLFYQDQVGSIAQTEPDVNGEIIPTNDGGAILVGYQQSPMVGSGGGTIFLLKIGPDELYAATDQIVSSSTFVSLEEPSNEIYVNVYPNPADERIFVEFPESDLAKYTITDLSGKIALTGEMQGSKSIDCSALPAGIYLLDITTERGRAVKKIVIE